MKTIGQQAFWGCSGLTSVVLPNGITNIEQHLFNGCSSLESLSLPNTVSSIDVYAFAGCSKLTSIEIPQKVETIGMFAFDNCSGLKEVRSYISKPFAISTLCFNKVNTDAITLYVPVGTKVKYETTEGWKAFKNIVEMEGSAVNAIITADPKNNSIHSLSGQRLTVPSKGINIINGRKVAVK